MLREALVQALGAFGGEVREKGEAIEFTEVLAERKAFLARKKLVYQATVWVDEAKREVHVWKSLTERSLGLSSESGAGFKAEAYRTRPHRREGTLAERAELFGKVCRYTFDFSTVRAALEVLAWQHGYMIAASLRS